MSSHSRMSGRKGVRVLGPEASADNRWLPVASVCRVLGGTTEFTAMLVITVCTSAGGFVELSAGGALGLLSR